MKKKASLICDKGLEEFAALELKNKYDIMDLEINTGAVSFQTDEKKLIDITYTSQSAKHIIVLFSKGAFDGTIEGLINSIKKSVDVNELKKISNKEIFKINCEREGKHNFNSVIAEQEIGKTIRELIKTDSTIDKYLKAKIMLIIEDNKYYFGQAINARDLSKRQYRLLSHPASIKGTLAFSFLMFSNYTSEKKLLDPFALSGEIPIEAAIFASNFPINYYEKEIIQMDALSISQEEITKQIEAIDSRTIADKKEFSIISSDASFSNLSAQKKNSKIAGVTKFIDFTRTNPGDLDLKLEPGSIDIIACKIIEPSKHIKDSKAKKIQEQFFEYISRTLSKKGVITFICRNPEFTIYNAKEKGFKLIEKKEIPLGDQTISFIKLKMLEG